MDMELMATLIKKKMKMTLGKRREGGLILRKVTVQKEDARKNGR